MEVIAGDRTTHVSIKRRNCCLSPSPLSQRSLGGGVLSGRSRRRLQSHRNTSRHLKKRLHVVTYGDVISVCEALI